MGWFILIVLLTAVAFIVGSIFVGYSAGRRQAVDNLTSVGILKETEIESWLRSLGYGLSSILDEEYFTDRASAILNLANRGKYYSYDIGAMRRRLEVNINRSGQFDEIALVDIKGNILLSTQQNREGKALPGFTPASLKQSSPYISLVASAAQPSQIAISIILPVVSTSGEQIGGLAGIARLDPLWSALNDRTGLGETGRSYLVNLDHSRISASSQAAAGFEVTPAEPADRLAGLYAALQSQQNGSGFYAGEKQQQVVGVYRWSPMLSSEVVVEMDLSEAFLVTTATVRVSVWIALAAVLLAAMAASLVTRSITHPLVDLVDTATQIASGDYQRTARVERKDEVGRLALAFNSMTAQLIELINHLEQKVAERTGNLHRANLALQRRTVQLETVAKVNREASSILDMDQLLARLANLIQEAFDFYHVNIFLSNEAGELILRASSGEGSTPIQSIPIAPTSLNGKSALEKAVVIANDTRNDLHFLFEERLPETAAEIVIPLRLGERLIGTLDVQSAQKDAFAQEDAQVFQSLGDQMAVAIENTRLYERNHELAVMEERTRMARELHDSIAQSLYSLGLFAEGWSRQAKDRGETASMDAMNRVGDITQQMLKEMRMMVHAMRPLTLEQKGLLGALNDRLEAVEKRVGIETHLQVEDFTRLPSRIEEELYWIAQEALNNALKYARATEVKIHLSVKGGQVLMAIADNGSGFAPGQVSQRIGMGIANMHSRAKNIGGTLDIISSPGKGAMIQVCAALPQPQTDSR